ncbi:MAG: tRNA (N(6)-L-threonylcarbamoyladenosine(37)-C(2))-methylthiotransferase MtaB [Rickettsiaceae bacterium]|nr:tRNA (N(6)-L-threonylcarbamoyladenosine(37)-C(2))-methylthiotransferase MtaB [Rickettsiaceae bacterium]
MSSQNQVVTFGCRLNIYESQIIKQNLESSGLDDVVVFNTCTVTKAAENEAIRSIKKLKKERPDAKIIVTGCAAQVNPAKFSSLKEVDKVLGNEEKLHAENYRFSENAHLNKALISDIMQVKEIAPHMVQNFTEHSRAFLQIQNGCDHRCTFCIIPYGRGPSRSVPIGSIAQEIRALVENGYNEIVLTGVDVTSYGADLPGTPSFAQAIRRLLAHEPRLNRLRLASIDVAEIDEDLFDLMAYEPRLMPHFHISLQSGDNMILKRMKRRHNRDDVINFCTKLRSLRSDVSFGADIIAGFPTETDQMFENSLNLILEADLQYLHVFPYSPREGTPAARMPQVEKSIRKERAAILRKTGAENLDKFAQKFDKKMMNILVEKGGVGRGENFLQVKVGEEEKVGKILSARVKYDIIGANEDIKLCAQNQNSHQDQINT